MAPTFTLTVVFTPYNTGRPGYTPDQVAVGSPEFENPRTPCLTGTCTYTIQPGDQAVLQAQAGFLGSTFGAGAKSRVKSWGGACASVDPTENLCVIPNIQEDKTVTVEMEFVNGPLTLLPNPAPDLNFGEQIQLNPQGGDQVTVDFEIVGGPSSIGSTLSSGGVFTAGDNQTGSNLVETVRATDAEGQTAEIDITILPNLGGASIAVASSLDFGLHFLDLINDVLPNLKTGLGLG